MGHPIPVVGSMVKSFTCIAGRMSKTIDDILKIEMKTLKLCLPDNGCEHDCVFQGSLLIPSLNFPVSDSMQRVANTVMGGYYQSTVNNYQRYLSECTEGFGGWTTHYKISQSRKKNKKTLNSIRQCFIFLWWKLSWTNCKFCGEE